MSDAEIIKALECCSKGGSCTEECPLYRTAGCFEELHKLILGRIRLQEPDVKDYQRNIIEMDKFARDLCNERLLNGNKITTFEDLQSYIDKQKAEAVKEFAEKLKGLIYPQLGVEVFLFCVDKIDNLVKEMTGGAE